MVSFGLHVVVYRFLFTLGPPALSTRLALSDKLFCVCLSFLSSEFAILESFCMAGSQILSIFCLGVEEALARCTGG